MNRIIFWRLSSALLEVISLWRENRLSKYVIFLGNINLSTNVKKQEINYSCCSDNIISFQKIVWA